MRERESCVKAYCPRSDCSITIRTVRIIIVEGTDFFIVEGIFDLITRRCPNVKSKQSPECMGEMPCKPCIDRHPFCLPPIHQFRCEKQSKSYQNRMKQVLLQP